MSTQQENPIVARGFEILDKLLGEETDIPYTLVKNETSGEIHLPNYVSLTPVLDDNLTIIVGDDRVALHFSV